MSQHVNSLPLPSIDGKPFDVNELVLGYLVHHGFGETANQFQADSRTPFVRLSASSAPINLQQDTTLLGTRRGLHSSNKEIINCIENGEIDQAISKIRSSFPSFQETHSETFLALLVQKFVLLVDSVQKTKRGQEQPLLIELLEFGTSLEEKYGNIMAHRQLLDSAFELVAFTDPRSRSQLFDNSSRIELADRINSAMLGVS